MIKDAGDVMDFDVTKSLIVGVAWAVLSGSIVYFVTEVRGRSFESLAGFAAAWVAISAASVAYFIAGFLFSVMVAPLAGMIGYFYWKALSRSVKPLMSEEARERWKRRMEARRKAREP